MLDQEGGEESQEQLASILEGVRDAIGRRLNGVSEGCNQVLTTASWVESLILRCWGHSAGILVRQSY
jgi:hypothetical protein